MTAPPTQTRFTGIQAVHEALKLGGYPNKLKSFDPRKPFQYIVMKPRPYLQPLRENEDRTYAMNILFMNDGLQSRGEAKLANANSLEFGIYLPFKLYLETMGETAFLMSAFNTLSPHASFGVNEDYLPFYRYSLKTRKPIVSALVVLEIVESMLFFADRLAAPLEDVACGEKTHLEGIKAAELAIGTPPEGGMPLGTGTA